MHLSKGVRVFLVVSAVLVGLMAFVSYGLEQEYGGNSATEGLARGHLPDGIVEIREVGWGLGAEANNDYEMRVEASDVAVVALVDGNGRVLFTGTTDQAISWLDTQGPQQFVGTNQSAAAYLTDLKDGATSYTTSIILAIVAGGLLVVSLIPNRNPRQSPAIGPATPTA